jgi:hypothetical protein
MHNVNLIFTQHKELGNCNSKELAMVIETIDPQVIFEELTSLQFDEFYVLKARRDLETDAIKEHLRNHCCEHIPVDTYERPRSFDDDREWVYDKLFNRTHLVEVRELRGLWDDMMALVAVYGIRYLNSDQYDESFAKFNLIKEKVLSIIGDEELIRKDRLVTDVNEKREFEILDNIYSYSKESIYKRALLFIGSGHRRPIIKKIEKYQKEQPIQLNWHFGLQGRTESGPTLTNSFERLKDF